MSVTVVSAGRVFGVLWSEPVLNNVDIANGMPIIRHLDI